jgi:predicted TIM-barrel fold metal-dependent hydrolase
MGATPAANQLLIDTDVHEVLPAGELLLPYLDAHWREFALEARWNQSSFPTELPYNHRTARDEWVLSDGRWGTDLDTMRQHLFDGEGVTLAILNGFFHASAVKGSYEFASALASAYNDWQVQNWLDKEPRLRGSVHVVVQDPQVAVREIDRMAEHPSIVQVFLPMVTDREYGDPRYHPIFEAAERNHLAVAMHHGGHTRTVLGYPRYFIEWHTTAAPLAGVNQLVSLIFNGVFDKYPDLHLVLLETGVAWVPWLMWRLDEQYRELRKEVPWVKRLPSAVMRDNVRVATQPMGDVKPDLFARLVEMSESERMFVFATDYPHYDADSADQTLPRSLPAELQERIRWRNAVESYPRLEKLSAVPALPG